jgi:cytochrome c oxidase subunit 2
MFAEIIWFPQEASSTARSVDQLLYILVTVCGSVGLLVAVLLIGFSIRYRRRVPLTEGAPVSPPAEMRGNTRLEIFWTVTPFFIFLAFFFLGAVIYLNAFRAPDDATVLYVVAKQWMWKIQHPEGQREINEIHVPVDRPIKLLMTSEDVIHSFFVPDFRVHMDVLPGRYTSVWFHPTRPGAYHLFCSQYCGTNHAGMIGTVHVLEQTEYQHWLQLHAEGSMALEGRKIFLKYRCVSCHSYSDREQPRAPLLEDLYLKTVHYHLPGETGTTQNWRTTLADEDYIRESILNPSAKIVAGYENIMPTFQGQVSAEEINELIAFIKSLRQGQTPKRVEEFPPPTTTPPINSTK